MADPLAELDALVAEIELSAAQPIPITTSEAPPVSGARSGPQIRIAPVKHVTQPIVVRNEIKIQSQFFETCPNCRSQDVSTNRVRGYSICETCGFAVNPSNRLSKNAFQKDRIVSDRTRRELAMLQQTHLAKNRRVLQTAPQANYEFFRAAQSNDIKQLSKFLDMGYDINSAETNTGSTALHWAASKSQQHAIRFLVEHGANINAQNRRGMTPLHILIVNKIEPLAMWLIMKGADTNITNGQGFTPIDLALPWTQTEMKETRAKFLSGGKGEKLKLPPPIKKERIAAEDVSPVEKKAASSQAKSVLKVYTKSGSYKSVMVTNTTSASDLVSSLGKKLALPPRDLRYVEIIERVKKGDQYLERKLPPTAKLLQLKAKWPMIFGKKGMETELHCRFILHLRPSAPEAVKQRYNKAIQ